MLIQVKDAKRINPKLFPKPDFSHIGKGNVTVSDPIFIPFEQILVPDDGQRGRVEDQPSADRITRIKHSFAPGVRTTEFLPAVIERNVDSDEPVKYELLYGVGRTWTFEYEMGAKGYWYNKIENATDSDLEWVCLTENEELEKTPNKELDVINSISRMIKRGDIKPTEKAIDEAIRHNLPFRRAESRGRRTTTALLKERSNLENKIFTAKGIGAFKKQLGAQRKFDQQEMQRIAERPQIPSFGPPVMIPGKQSGFSKFTGALMSGLGTYSSSLSAIDDIKGFVDLPTWVS